MKKAITQKYSSKAESILSGCFVVKPVVDGKVEYCEAENARKKGKRVLTDFYGQLAPFSRW